MSKIGKEWYEFKRYTYGFVDTIDLLRAVHPNKEKYNLSYLTKEILGVENKNPNCEDDVSALARLVTHSSISSFDITQHIDQSSLSVNKSDKLCDDPVIKECRAFACWHTF